MTVWQRFKNIFSKKNEGGEKKTRSKGKIIGAFVLLAANVCSITAATIAWFSLAKTESRIEMVVGDINVDIKKVTAYKYVYPYYKSSTEYVDYNNGGTVKKYILSNNELTYNDGVSNIPVNPSSITSSTVNITVTLSETAGNYSIAETAGEGEEEFVLSPSFIHYDGRTEFRYFLIGDDIFAGADDHPWTITNSIAFAKKDEVSSSTSTHPVAENVFISAGASFIFYDRYQITSIQSHSCKYFTYSISGSNTSPFIIAPDGKSIMCLKSGLYKVTYSPNKLKIEETPRDDGSIFNNNSLDVTKMKIDYDGSNTINKTNPNLPDYCPDLASYLATGVYDQNTTLILDVELNYKNVNQITAALDVVRDPANSQASNNYIKRITNNGYQDNTKNIKDQSLPGGNNISPLNASDFFSFNAVFTATPYADSESIWTALHRKTDIQTNNVNDFSKFNTSSFDTSINCQLHLKEQGDSLIIQPNNSDSQRYHCYIAIDYDYAYVNYFAYEKRLSQNYHLYRDFGFHFIGIQSLES